MAQQLLARASWGTCEGAFVLRLTGPIRYPVAPALRAFLDEALTRTREHTVLLDLRGVESLDSTCLGLLARVGRSSLEALHRHAIIVCPDNDVATTLRSAAFDTLFAMTSVFPFDATPVLTEEVPLQPPAPGEGDELGPVVLEAHRALGSLSEENRRTYRDVIATLEAELRRGAPH